jgi:hypothetical protein
MPLDAPAAAVAFSANRPDRRAVVSTRKAKLTARTPNNAEGSPMIARAGHHIGWLGSGAAERSKSDCSAAKRDRVLADRIASA